MGIVSLGAKVGFLAGVIAVCLMPRSHHKEDENGKIILDADFLSNPGFPILVDLFAAYGKPFAEWYAPLDVETVLKKAQERTGLTKFWAEDEEYWRKGLELLLYSIREEVDGFNALGRIASQNTIVEALESQLIVQNYLDKHPAVKDIEIEGPLVITGLPRTGSTHLQIALCASQQFNCLRYFESRFPVAPDGMPVELVGGEKDPRVEAAWRTISGIHSLRPLFPYMHSWGATTAFEEMPLTAMVFGSEFYASMWQELPAYSEWLANADHTPAFRFVKTCFQIIQFQTGATGRPWLMKSPQNARMISPIRSVFPEAKFVITHRNPAHVLKSLLSMLMYVSSIQVNRPHRQTAEFWMNAEKTRIEAALEAIAHEKDLQVAHVKFERFMDDQISTIVKILKFAGVDSDDEVVGLVQSYLDSNPRTGANILQYSFEPFNTTVEEINELFRDYNALELEYI